MLLILRSSFVKLTFSLSFFIWRCSELLRLLSSNLSQIKYSFFSNVHYMIYGDLPKLPGPRGLPFIGYLPFLGRCPDRTLGKLTEKYGKTFLMSAGTKRFVILNSIETIREIEKNFPQELCGKPKPYTTGRLNSGAHNDMLERWRRRRAYLSAGLKQLHGDSVEDIIHDEVNEFIDILQKQSEKNQSMDVEPELAFVVSKAISHLCYGEQMTEDMMKNLREMVALLPDYSRANSPLCKYNLLPLIRYLSPDGFQKFLEFCSSIKRYCENEKTRDIDGTDEPARTYYDLKSFFFKKYSSMSEHSKSKWNLNENVLLDGLEDVLRATTENSSLIVTWVLIYLARYPEIQKKVRDEISGYMQLKGKTELRSTDISELNYTRAVLNETHRICSLHPFLKRQVLADIMVDGHRLPRGTEVLVNNWSINHDPQVFPQPDRFLPDRFLLPDGTFNIDLTTRFLPFGFGKRICVGPSLAFQIYSQIATSILGNFSVEFDPAQEIDLEPIFGFNNSPKPHKLVFHRSS